MQCFIGAALLATCLSLSGLAAESSAAAAPSITVTLSPPSIVAGGTSKSTATVTITDATGAPVPGEIVTISSSDPGETISAVTDNGNGTYTATITSSTTPGQATITATDASATLGPLSATATLTQTPRAAAAITLALSPTSIVANGTSTSTATVTITDTTGVGVPGEKVTISSSDPGEKISAVRDNGNGTYTATITSSTTRGQATITATDTTANLTSAATLIQTSRATAISLVLQPPSIVANGISTTTATVTVASPTGGVPGEKVTISSSDPGERISAVRDNGNGTYTATITSSTTRGQATITATDASVTSSRLSASATLIQISRATAITVALQPPSIVANRASTSTATVTITDATGAGVAGENVTISSSDPGEKISAVTYRGNGTYTATITSSTTPGQATITAADAAANLAATATLTQTSTGTTTSLVAAPSAAVTNQPVTLFASVTATSGSPSGTITFKNHGNSIGGCVDERITPSNSSAACTTSFAASTSPEQLTAVFTPAPSSTLAGSASSVAFVTVAQDTNSTSLDASSKVNVRANTTYTATVTPSANRPGPVGPSGSVEFFDRGQPIAACLSQPLTGGGATCTVRYKSVGKHSITARYSGDANFTGSSSSARVVRVVRAHARGTITATMQWSFFYTPRYTKVLALVVNGATPGATVRVKCHGRGCPFVKRAKVVQTRRCGSKAKRRCSTQGSRINLTPTLKNHRLHVGARINVDVVRRSWIGKYYMFTVRSGRGPRVKISCLAPGSRRPGVRC